MSVASVKIDAQQFPPTHIRPTKLSFPHTHWDHMFQRGPIDSNSSYPIKTFNVPGYPNNLILTHIIEMLQ